MRKTFAVAALATALMCGTALAQQITVKIGVLTDMNSLYADDTGIGSVIAARMAAAEFMKDHPNVKVEVISGDHQNKADLGVNLANQWYDVEKVDMIADVPNSGVALAITQVAAQKNKVVRRLGPGLVRPHRPEVQRQQRAVDLRHLDAGERHRQGDGEAGRR